MQVGKAGALLWGVQTRPALELGPLFSVPTDRQALVAAAQQTQLATSYAVAYRPEGQVGTRQHPSSVCQPRFQDSIWAAQHGYWSGMKA